MIKLYLQNRLMELDDDVQISLSKYFENISKPTNRYVEWSKTVSIPYTQANNQFFAAIYNPDRVITTGTSNIGIDFDPYKKIDMRLEYSNSTIMLGYAKMENSTWDGSTGHYEITLFGELGKIYQELNKIKIGTPSDNEDSTYYIDGSQYYSETMNRQLIYKSWNTNQSNINDYKLYKKGETQYVNTNIIGWTPLNIRTDNDTLDQSSFEKENEVIKFTDVLGALQNPSFVDATKCNPDTAIGDGMMPREIGEWRSYLQQPFMYFNKLIQMVGNKCYELTGYKFDLTDDWFSSANKYYKDVVLTLKNFEKQDNDFLTNSYNNTFKTISWVPQSVSVSDYTVQKQSQIEMSNASEAVPIYDSTNKVFNLSNRPNVGFNFNNRIYVSLSIPSSVSATKIDLKDDNALILTVVMSPKKGSLQSQRYILTSPDTTVKNALKNLYPDAYYMTLNSFSKELLYTTSFDITVPFFADSANEKAGFYILANFYKNAWPFTRGSADDSGVQISYKTAEPGVLQANVFSSYNRTGSNVNLNTLWNSDYLPFTIIMNYCKMFRIGIFDDYINKTVKFIPYSTYFQDYTITDWTDKVDKSKDFIVQPITFDNKWILFNYDDNSSKLNETYKTKNSVQFGEYKIDTHYVFNDETENLFENVKCPLENTDNVLSWTNLYENMRIIYSFPAEKYVYSKDDSNKLIDNFGTFYFDGGVVPFDTEARLYLRNNIITDDSRLQRGTGKYYYNQYSDKTKTSNYHQLSLFSGDDMITFTTPKTTFCYQDYSGKKGLYELFWKNYLDERYNVQNKIVTCYLEITPLDYYNFDFRHFIRISNQLYFVNKIIDYDPTSEYPTKCELITIQNVKGYTDDDYVVPYLIVTKGGKKLPSEIHYKVTDTDEWILSSSSNWTWEDSDRSLQGFYINGEDGSGSGNAGNNIKLVIDPSLVSKGDSGFIVFENEDGLRTGTVIYID